MSDSHQFENRLCGCTDDATICVAAAILPCGCPIIQGKAVGKALGKGCAFPCVLYILLGCIGGAMNRAQIREVYEIEGSFVQDCCVHCWCTPCAVCQEYREVNYRIRKEV